jgi:hypothetical protein
MAGFGDILDEREEDVEYDPYFAEGTFSGYSRRAPKSQVDPKAVIKKRSEAKKTEPAKPVTAPAVAPISTPKKDIPQSPEGIKNLQAKADDETFNLMQYIKGREASMEKAAAQDKNMALLAAGLGMLGGTSQYAFENIGKGGLAGVQQLAASQKTRAAQEAALGKLYGAASETELMNRLRRDQLAQGKEKADEDRVQRFSEKRNAFIQKELGQNPMLSQMLQSLKGEKAKAEATGKQLDPKKLVQLNFYEQQMKDLENKAFRLFPDPDTKSNYRLVGVR